MNELFSLPWSSLVCRRNGHEAVSGRPAYHVALMPKKQLFIQLAKSRESDGAVRGQRGLTGSTGPALYRPSPLASRGAQFRARPGSLQWMKARQTASLSADTPSAETNPTDRPESYTREAAARRLGVGKKTVWELATRGVIAAPIAPAQTRSRRDLSGIPRAWRWR